MLKAKVQKLGDTLNVLRSNYDFQGPTSSHDQAVITQLSNDLWTLEATVFTIEHYLQ